MEAMGAVHPGNPAAPVPAVDSSARSYDWPMAYDEDLAWRIRELLSDAPGVSEQKMFGGLAFLVDGHLAVAASGQGGLLVRVDPAESERLVATTRGEIAVMGGRRMRGWLRVSGEHVGTKRQLAPWVRRGVASAGKLPPKQ
jgi:TfoX/Sxy family transcriptional regulator of competence genes